MERTILFRGKVKYNGNHLFSGDWVYGSLIIATNGIFFYVIDEDKFGNIVREFEVEVIPETVGQFTGLTDKNGVRVFEGDILSGCNGSINGYEWKQDPFEIKYKYGNFNVPLWAAMEEWDSTHYLTVIGNIHDKHK